MSDEGMSVESEMDEEDGSIDCGKAPSCPEFIVPPEGKSYDVYKIFEQGNRLFNLPKPSRSNSLKKGGQRN